MPYIPKEHEKYDLLPFCREKGGEVFQYPSPLVDEVGDLLGSLDDIFPYGYKSYEEYYGIINSLIADNSGNSELVEKLTEFLNEMQEMNQKEEWSVLKYIGPTDDAVCGLTHGQNYYWPTRKSNPVYNGVIDDEEFTSYLYATEADMWEILEDPTGMAYRTIYQMDRHYMSKREHAGLIAQIEEKFGQQLGDSNE